LRAFVSILVVAVLLGGSGCSGERPAEVEAATSTPGLREDYAVFAVRCSKCHSLARPLNSGIDDDEYWKAYVAKMRRQPGSGISLDDSVVILRFLHAFSIELRRKKGLLVDAPDAALADPDALPPGAAR
jgi:hypothetical protein